MADPTWRDKIAALLRASPGAQPAQAMPQPAPPQMGGMAGNAQQILQSRPYQLHVQEAQAMGQQPMTPEQFAAQMGR
tara:strand:- start:1111 stop:1341 length:231 start_codon:yes stop_codon:yes gene_type:complete